MKTVLCCLLYDSCTFDQFLNLSVGFRLRFSFVHLFRFCILCVFFWFSLDYFVLVLFAFVVLDLVSSALCQEIGWEEHL